MFYKKGEELKPKFPKQYQIIQNTTKIQENLNENLRNRRKKKQQHQIAKENKVN